MDEPEPIERELDVPIPGVILPQEQWARTAIKRLPAEGPLDWAAIFGRRAPLVVDLGCGNGRFVIASALVRPEMDHLGLDILPMVIRYATRRANQRGLWNVRLAVCGGQEFLDRYAAPGTIAEIHVYHPQPYGDAQKIGRRLVTPAFLAAVHRALVPGGLWVVQTDNSGYWRYLAAVAPRFFEFHQQPGPWPDAPQGRTRREIMARAMGLPIFRGWGTPRGELDAASRERLVNELPAPKFDAAIVPRGRGRGRRQAGSQPRRRRRG
jgi:tRNA (guanine-N7-)-methyltransferase